MRESETLAPMGGDEFAILMTDLSNEDEAIRVAAKLLVALHPAYCLKDQVLHSGAIFLGGCAFYPDDTQNCDTLLRYADLAMHLRVVKITLTCWGRSAATEIPHVRSRMQNASLSGVSADEFEALKGFLRRILLNAQTLTR